MIRSFVGIDMPEDVADALSALAADLPFGRVPEPDTLHLTLAFLGEMPAPALEDIHTELSRLDAAAFTLRLSGPVPMGAPRPRLLVAEAEASPALRALQAQVVRRVRAGGLQLPRRRFRPHVTLARFGDGVSGHDRAELDAFIARNRDAAAGDVAVEDVRLWRSTLTRRGPVHDELARYPLAGAAPAR